MEETVEADPQVADNPLPPLIITSVGVIEHLPVADRAAYQYRTPENKTAIVEAYMAGNSLHKIAQIGGMPSYGSILRWAKEDSEFRAELESARTIRGWHHEEQALLAADGVLDKNDVPAARLKFDANVWAAEVNNPTMYGKRTTIAGDAGRPLQFTILTGVPQRDDEKAIELNKDGTIKE